MDHAPGGGNRDAVPTAVRASVPPAYVCPGAAPCLPRSCPGAALISADSFMIEGQVWEVDRHGKAGKWPVVRAWRLGGGTCP